MKFDKLQKKNGAIGSVIFVIIGMVLVLASKYFPNKIFTGAVVALAIGGLLFILFLIAWFIYKSLVHKHKQVESRRRAEEWKLRISSMADNTELFTRNEVYKTFDDLCYFEDDDFLNQVLQELEEMPRGERKLSKAYETVEAKVYHD